MDGIKSSGWKSVNGKKKLNIAVKPRASRSAQNLKYGIGQTEYHDFIDSFFFFSLVYDCLRWDI